MVPAVSLLNVFKCNVCALCGCMRRDSGLENTQRKSDRVPRIDRAMRILERGAIFGVSSIDRAESDRESHRQTRAGYVD